jgi:hypothetical protein
MVYFIFKLIPRSTKHANLLTTYVHLKLFLNTNHFFQSLLMLSFFFLLVMNKQVIIGQIKIIS